MSEKSRQILITGASRGIGRAIAERLATEKCRIILHGRDKAALEETDEVVTAAGSGVRIAIADLSVANGVEALVRAVKGRLDVLINNAGIAIVKPIEELTLDDWQRTLDINVTGPFLLTKLLLPQLENGSIVNIMSIAARAGFPNWSSYCMSKFAIEGFSQALREELRPRNIRVVNIYPGATNTAIWNDVPGAWSREKMLDPAEVAEAVAYAVSRPANVAVENLNVGNIAGTL